MGTFDLIIAKILKYMYRKLILKTLKFEPQNKRILIFSPLSCFKDHRSSTSDQIYRNFSISFPC